METTDVTKSFGWDSSDGMMKSCNCLTLTFVLNNFIKFDKEDTHVLVILVISVTEYLTRFWFALLVTIISHCVSFQNEFERCKIWAMFSSMSPSWCKQN